MIMLKYINHNKISKYERILISSYVAECVYISNVNEKYWGKTLNQLNDFLNAINERLENTPQSHTGKIDYNFEFELLSEQKKINLWHIKISTGERDALISEIFEED